MMTVEQEYERAKADMCLAPGTTFDDYNCGRGRETDMAHLVGIVQKETDKAILFLYEHSSMFGRLSAVWLPKSQCEVRTKPSGDVVVVLPLWLARDKYGPGI